MKKNLYFLVLITFLSINVFAQGSLKYSITIKDTSQKPIKNLKIVMKESATNEKIVYYTDYAGTANIELDHGGRWWMTIGKMYKYQYLDVPEYGRASGSELMTYDIKSWEHEHQPMFNRSGIQFSSIEQKLKTSDRPKSDEVDFNLHVKRSDRSGLPVFPVTITCIEDKIKYKAMTNGDGTARLMLPYGKTYEIDIDGIESYDFVELPERSGRMNYYIVYDPTDIDEKTVNDTVYQKLSLDYNATSARVKYYVEVMSSSGELAADEPVYLSLVGSNLVYFAKTDNEGKAHFLLPIKKQYLINLEYQKDIDVINLMRVKGIGEGHFSLTYHPDPKLEFPERYIPTSQDLLIEEFNNFLTKQFPKPVEDKPFRLFIKWGNELINSTAKEAILHVGFSSADNESEAYGPPVNVSFVVDKSGSMAGYERIESLKESMLNFVGHLRQNDHVSFISFNDVPELVISGNRMAEIKDELIQEINFLEAGGGTNIYKAMIVGYEEVLKSYKKGGTNRLLLLTDGYGSIEIDTIVNKSKEYNAKGVDISAIGVGSNYNQALLKLLSGNSGGMFQHVGQAYDLKESFRRELNGMLYPIATNVSIEIEFNEKIIFSNLYGFEFSKSGKKVIMKLDNIYPNMNELTIVKFNLEKADKSIEKLPVVIRMKYFNYKTQKQELITEKAFLKWTEETGQYELVHEAEEKRLYAIAIMNQSLKVMADAFSADDYQKALDAVNRAIEQINNLYPDARDEDVDKLYKRLREYAHILIQYKKNVLKKM